MSQGNRNAAAVGEAFKVHGRAAARKPRRGPARNGPVTTTQLSPLAEELALQLAGGDRARFRIISVTVIVVENRPRGGLS